MQDIEELSNSINTIILQAADIAIPVKSGVYRKRPFPWWNRECEEAVKERELAERVLKRSNLENKIRYKRRKAKCRYILNNARKQAWGDYVMSIKKRISMNKVGKKVQKISGKYTAKPTSVVKGENREIEADLEKNRNIIAASFAVLSDDTNQPQQFIRHKNIIEQQVINFDTGEMKPCNEMITIRKYEHALGLTNETSSGVDRITYSMLKHTHLTLAQTIVKTFNRIYSENTFPMSWRTAIIIPILTPDKSPTDSTSYRSISLASCLCKIMEKILNNRLIWYLEYNKCINKE